MALTNKQKMIIGGGVALVVLVLLIIVLTHKKTIVPTVSTHSITMPAVSTHSITIPTVSTHSITMPDGTTTTITTSATKPNNLPNGQLPTVGKQFYLKGVNGYIIGNAKPTYTLNKENATIYTMDSNQNLTPVWALNSAYPISLVQNSTKTNTLILLTSTSYAIDVKETIPGGYGIVSVDDALDNYTSSYAVTVEYV